MTARAGIGLGARLETVPARDDSLRRYIAESRAAVERALAH